MSKNNAAIKVPYRLELEGHCINKGPLTYELFALSEHSGSARGGHYIAYSRRGSEWFYFSDGNVKGTSWEKVRSSQPYILFYKRIEWHLSWLSDLFCIIIQKNLINYVIKRKRRGPRTRRANRYRQQQSKRTKTYHSKSQRCLRIQYQSW